MRRETILIGIVVLVVLLPMWYVGLMAEEPAEEVVIDQAVSDVRPLDGFVDAPTKLSPGQVGVIVWWALLVLIGVLYGAHRFMNRAVRREADVTDTAADGGRALDVGLPWLRSESRWVVESRPATESGRGLAVMAGLTVLAIVFAALFTGEYLTLARTQYFGVYAAGLFFSLAALTVAYYAWFMPHVEVVERREH